MQFSMVAPLLYNTYRMQTMTHHYRMHGPAVIFASIEAIIPALIERVAACLAFDHDFMLLHILHALPAIARYAHAHHWLDSHDGRRLGREMLDSHGFRQQRARRAMCQQSVIFSAECARRRAAGLRIGLFIRGSFRQYWRATATLAGRRPRQARRSASRRASLQGMPIDTA